MSQSEHTSIPFLSLDHQHQQAREEVLAAMANVYDRNWFVAGEELHHFENEYASYCNVSHCVGVGNGLDALYLALKALSIGPGDEVIVPTNTFIATWISVSRTGATIIPVEPLAATYNIDVRLVERLITPQTKAIIPVHLYGQACEMDSLMALAARYDVAVVEDNAQGHGATYDSRKTGSFGLINATSFYPTKNLGAAGDGGAVTTHNELLGESVRVLRNYGSRVKNYNEVIGINSRLDEIQAAILRVKLRYLEQWNRERQRLASILLNELTGIDDFILPHTADKATHVYHLFVVRTSRRDAVQSYLAKSGIGTMIHYPLPPHLQQAYSNLEYSVGDFPIAEALSATSLSLPLWPGMSDQIIDRLIREVRRFYA